MLRRYKPLRWLAATGLAVLVAGCSAASTTPSGSPPPTGASAETAAEQTQAAIGPVVTSERDWQAVVQTLGRPATSS